MTTIWLYTFSDHGAEKIAQPEGRSNDTDPMWIGDKVYFLSDRNGEFNLFSFDTSSQAVEQLLKTLFVILSQFVCQLITCFGDSSLISLANSAGLNGLFMRCTRGEPISLASLSVSQRDVSSTMSSGQSGLSNVALAKSTPVIRGILTSLMRTSKLP